MSRPCSHMNSQVEILWGRRRQRLAAGWQGLAAARRNTYSDQEHYQLSRLAASQGLAAPPRNTDPHENVNRLRSHQTLRKHAHHSHPRLQHVATPHNKTGCCTRFDVGDATPIILVMKSRLSAIAQCISRPEACMTCSNLAERRKAPRFHLLGSASGDLAGS